MESTTKGRFGHCKRYELDWGSVAAHRGLAVLVQLAYLDLLNASIPECFVDRVHC